MRHSYYTQKCDATVKEDNDVDKWFEKMRRSQKLTPQQIIQKQDEQLSKKGFQINANQSHFATFFIHQWESEISTHFKTH